MDERLAEFIRKLYGLANYDNLRTAGEVASMTPTPVGDFASGMLALDDLRKGDYLGAAGNAVGLLPFVPGIGGIIAKHGSPHLFDKFDLAKARTGEGTMREGHGVYLSDSESYARNYATNLPGGRSNNAFLDATIRTIARQYADGDIAKVAEIVKKNPTAFKNPDKILSRLDEYKGAASPGRIYDVEIPDKEVKNFLNWDSGGRETYESLERKLGSAKAASESLSAQGIKGATYNSAHTLGDIKNYVVYDPEILKILGSKSK